MALILMWWTVEPGHNSSGGKRDVRNLQSFAIRFRGAFTGSPRRSFRFCSVPFGPLAELSFPGMWTQGPITLGWLISISCPLKHSSCRTTPPKPGFRPKQLKTYTVRWIGGILHLLCSTFRHQAKRSEQCASYLTLVNQTEVKPNLA